jgi:signal peptidase II
MQAARGASLNPSDPDQSRHQTDPASRRTALRFFVAVAAGLYLVDVVTKAIAVAELPGRGRVPLLGDLLGLHLTRNPGAAFGTGTGYTIVFTLIAAVAALIVLRVSRRLGSRTWAVALGALLAGVAGNLTDRIVREPGPFHGHVVDFLELPNWPIFNIADICINVAAVLIVIQSFRGVRVDGSRDTHQKASDD